MTRTNSKGMGGHHKPYRGASDNWVTPKFISAALGSYKSFDIDPCACRKMPWKTARTMIQPPYDGLQEPWRGRVWLNPPYGPDTGKWLAKLADHGNGIALVMARTETHWFFESIWELAGAVLFLKSPRLHFHRPNGQRAAHNCGAPSCLVAYGRRNVEALKNCGLPGKLIELRSESNPMTQPAPKCADSFCGRK